jgi:hypothetical protein
MPAWIQTRPSVEIAGNSQLSNGSIYDDVLAKEKVSVEKYEMRIAHRTGGTQFLRN